MSVTHPLTRRKASKPVSGSCRWLIPPLVARGVEVGVLGINGTEYTVTLGRNPMGDVSGVRLTKDTETQYHVDLERQDCDCPDRQYRGRACKHLLACKAAVAVLAVA
jgi:hypothetical protein